MTGKDLFDKYDALLAERDRIGFTDPDPLNVVIDEVLSPTEAVIAGRRTILAGTNNYMGMTFDPDAIAAARAALETHGTGTTGSRILNGTYGLHRTLEETLAEFYNMAHAIVFSTGYQANLAMITGLVRRGDYVLIDADNHASIYDACAMGQADVVRFAHNDPESLARRLRRLPGDSGKLVVVESIYSMLGDRAPLAEIVEVVRRAGAQILVDEAHAMGFCGATGRGVTQELGLEDEVDFIVGTFSKSVGTIGGYAVSNHPKFDVLRLAARPYMFTASLPPSVVASATASIRKLAAAHEKRAHVWTQVERLHKGLAATGFRLATDRPESPIVAVCFDEQETMFAMCQALLAEGVYVNVARPPATPQGMFVLRCSLGAGHTPEQVDAILAAFAAAAGRLGLDLSETPRGGGSEDTATPRPGSGAAAATRSA